MSSKQLSQAGSGSGGRASQREAEGWLPLTLASLKLHDGGRDRPDQGDDRSDVESQTTSMHTVLPTAHLQQRGAARSFTRIDAQWVRKHGVREAQPGGRQRYTVNKTVYVTDRTGRRGITMYDAGGDFVKPKNKWEWRERCLEAVFGGACGYFIAFAGERRPAGDDAVGTPGNGAVQPLAGPRVRVAARGAAPQARRRETTWPQCSPRRTRRRRSSSR